MKIVRIKTKKTTDKKDMFAVLCLLQSLFAVAVVVLIFVVSKVDSDKFIQIKSDIEKIFKEDFDIGGYFTPFESKKDGGELYDAKQVAFVSTEVKPEYQSKYEFTVKEDTLSEFYYSEAVMPVSSGIVTSSYGSRMHPVYSVESFHSGIDIAASEGSKIYAVLDGTVTDAGYADTAGYYVRIEHENDKVTLYCHCSELFVEKGINVRKGDVIAAVGQTGLATGPHLHLEYYENGKTVDPQTLLDKAQNVY